MSSSLISTIKSAILTETNADVKIHERSLASALIEYNKDSEHNAWQDFKLILKLSKGKSLIFTRWLLRFVYLIFLGIIGLVYLICNVIYFVFTAGKWRGMKKASSGINAIIVSLFFIFAIVSIVYALTFNIREVVLFPGNAHVNAEGVISIDQPCHETHSFFLLNSATLWQSTGIPISEGDVVYITASGSVYSDVAELKKHTQNNVKLKYERNLYNVNAHKGDTKSAKYCIYGRGKKDTNAQFGTLLYKISSENSQKYRIYNDDTASLINQIDFSESKLKKSFKFEAKTSGILYLAFNDIYLDEIIVNKIKDTNNRNTDTYKELESLVKTIDKVSLDSFNYKDSKLRECPDIWFKDNLGEILVNIRVEKNIGTTEKSYPFSLFASAYRNIKHRMDEIKDIAGYSEKDNIPNGDSINNTDNSKGGDSSAIGQVVATENDENIRFPLLSFLGSFPVFWIVLILLLFFAIDIIISAILRNLDKKQITIREIFQKLKIRIRKLKIYKYYESHKRRI
ncbi:MAG: hypothetical protein J5542_06455 [Bacteroidales bacterium]|nr:hypothetical protein [Bacteroidales bacterium]